MKIYNNFNEMFNAQSGVKSNLSVFNYYEPWERFVVRIALGIGDAVDEWYNNLTDERKEAILSHIPEGGDAHNAWDYLHDKEWDRLYDTTAYNEMRKSILNGNPSKMFNVVIGEDFVRERLKDCYGLNYWDTRALRDDYYPRRYEKGVVDDAIYWVGEEMDGYDWWTYLEPKIEELQETYWDGKQGRFDFDNE